MVIFGTKNHPNLEQVSIKNKKCHHLQRATFFIYIMHFASNLIAINLYDISTHFSKGIHNSKECS